MVTSVVPSLLAGRTGVPLRKLCGLHHCFVYVLIGSWPNVNSEVPGWIIPVDKNQIISFGSTNTEISRRHGRDRQNNLKE
ncbi:hypothetical protein RRG08_042679 [Elysia crispata]|uniref:Uncharacterized protein n=1 Tax=Elysia crispata TaxID=231223 RepID=A0AAE0XQ63_9GAST|nr:hypothetical protein RRG08_042679 [Elysia crispata]